MKFFQSGFFNYFKELGKRIFDNIKSERVKNNLLTAIPFWLGSIIVGCAAVFYAQLFLLGENLLVKMIHNRIWLLFIIMPVAFIVSWWLVKRFSPYARGSGIPQVMAAIEFANPKDYDKVKRLLSVKIIFYKVVSSFILVLGGGAIGREGPTIQISGAIFNKIYEILPGWWPRISRKSMIVTGAAAGLSAAFNTPLGGVVFAVEELTKIHFNHFKTAVFTAVIIAGLTAQQLAGTYLYLGFPKTTAVSFSGLMAIVLLGLLAGAAASYLSKTILLLQRWRNSFNATWKHLLFLVLSAWIIASLAYFVSEHVLGSGKELMEQYLFTSQKHAKWYDPVLRLVGPALSFASGGAGGIFAPALSGGATIGSLFSGWFGFTATETNVMILAGMVAFLTGITRAPFTSAILVLEMTDRHSLILHLMLAAIVANVVARIINKHSFTTI
ncbi:chloride channel protein [Niabella ginsengisoli]|uniref:Chloride channel protein n=1 Tax=Niabella ginsengisoli TaxID=522298 RepID=A0ABS9SDH2_9BACT|nr:chloride channel protein [Niabella ginsengisoli]MCH5596418.1 chloride channel protein [Niabella ginsengisoli]